MASWIALLRGVNVGAANRVAMSEVKAAFAARGWRAVRSVGQAGNLVFDAEGEAAALEQIAEAALSEGLGLATAVMMRREADWRSMIACNPFVAEAVSDPARLVMVATKAMPRPDAEEALAAIARRERARVIGRAAYIVYPDGQAGSRLAGSGLDRALGTLGTARNWNTVLKLAEMLPG